MAFYCYILCNTDEKYKNCSYVGYTVNPARRIRQHNGEIVGGSKSTHKKGHWEFFCVISGFKTSNNAMSCEWRLKHPDNKKRKNKMYCGLDGRILTLNKILSLDKWTEKCDIDNTNCKYKYYIHQAYKSEINVPEIYKRTNISNILK